MRSRARDFDGWVQERGLYFMDKWDEHFKPLLSCHDPGEDAQKGGLLQAQYGKGTYIYTGYAFFRQLPAGVPGAVRLYVNLLSAGHEKQSLVVFSCPSRKCQPPSQDNSTSPGLIRGMGLGSATALNMIDMIGVGPFITMPLVLSAMGGPQAMLGWVVGALLAVCDGLVSAELGAALPGSGGSYRYLSEIYGPRKWGRLISFLFIWQLSFSAPLSIASGCIGLAGYAAYYWPRLETVYAAHTAALHIPWAGPLAGELDCDAGNCTGDSHLLLHRLVALSADHGDRATFEATVGRRDGNDRMDHLRRADALQRRARVRFSSGRVYSFARVLHRVGRSHAGGHLRLLGLLQRLLSGR